MPEEWSGLYCRACSTEYSKRIARRNAGYCPDCGRRLANMSGGRNPYPIKRKIKPVRQGLPVSAPIGAQEGAHNPYTHPRHLSTEQFFSHLGMTPRQIAHVKRQAQEERRDADQEGGPDERH